MKTSVVLSSYNGEKYIAEQLESIRNQTVPADEVIIKDDRSTDDTVKVIRDYIADNALNASWSVMENGVNLGWKRNFIEVMKMASGDIVFLCDQDDIWLPNKIEEMVKGFENPAVELLVSDFVPFSDDGVSSYVFHPKLGNGLVSFVPCDVHFKDVRRPGCTYCFRRELLDYIDEIWFDVWPHDSYLWTVAIVRNGLYSYNRPLIKYRRHVGNNTPSNEKSKDKRVKNIEFQERIAALALSHAELLKIPRENIVQIEKARKFYAKRRESVQKGTIAGFIRMVPYLSYYPKKASILGDILSSRR